MKKLSLALALALGACASVDNTLADPQAQQNITLACGAVQIADSGFKIAVSAGYVNPDSQALEAKIVSGVAALCKQPYPQNTVDAVKAIFSAAAQLSGMTAIAHGTVAQ